MPNYMGKIVDFVIHWKDWRAAGYPTRSPAWVRELFAICKGCEWYDPEGKNPFSVVGLCPKGICTKCGCHVSDDPDDDLNALKFPTKPCPVGKFKAIVEVEPNPNRKDN